MECGGRAVWISGLVTTLESNDAKLELGRQKNSGFILGKAGKNDNAVQIL